MMVCRAGGDRRYGCRYDIKFSSEAVMDQVQTDLDLAERMTKLYSG